MAKEDRKKRVSFVCQQCGKESLKWLGRCPQCQEWNSFVETVIEPEPPSPWLTSTDNRPRTLSEISLESSPRIKLPFKELNSLLGGGLVPGSLVLIGGDPGIGKSTLLLQIISALHLPGKKTLYISGEESPLQIKLRAERLGVQSPHLSLLSETQMESIMHHLGNLSPSLVVLDSIQTVYLAELTTSPGSIAQIRESTLKLLHWAKSSGASILISGHVTKEGSLAGPRVLEHIVDVVLYMEGEPFSSYRILRSVKNRFGSTNEVAVFEMKDSGLVEVDNPSLAFLSGRRENSTGSVVVSTLEGTRPLLAEIQSLTHPTAFGLPRRMANGLDLNRLYIIAAVLSKRAGLPLSQQDIIINVAGGLRLMEPAVDLGMALAIASSFHNRPLDSQLVAMGEVGLGGEIRAVPQLSRRIDEATKLGFKLCMVPQASKETIPIGEGVRIIKTGHLREAIKQALNTQTADSNQQTADSIKFKNKN